MALGDCSRIVNVPGCPATLTPPSAFTPRPLPHLQGSFLKYSDLERVAAGQAKTLLWLHPGRRPHTQQLDGMPEKGTRWA